VILIEHYVLF